MYSVFDDKGYTSLKFKSIREAEKCAEDWRDSYMGDGVDLDSYIAIIQWANEDDFEEIKRWNIEINEQQHKELGDPRENGCDFDFWAKWTEPYESEQYKELLKNEKEYKDKSISDFINNFAI